MRNKTEELKKEIEKTWNKVCELNDSLEFNTRQELFIKTKEKQAELKGRQERQQEILKLIDEWDKKMMKKDSGDLDGAIIELKEHIMEEKMKYCKCKSGLVVANLEKGKGVCPVCKLPKKLNKRLKTMSKMFKDKKKK